jgi:serine phosphatase RsbU (regulator of sigma subunit)
VGGDYFDLFNADDGCWIGIGDVTGHGLLAGMIMLMMQSAVSALVNGLPDASPSRIVSQLNRVLRLNIRERLGESDHATFAMLRFRSDGRLMLAGAHEDPIVYRAAAGRCERIALRGVWLGIAEDIEADTPDQNARLERGDILLLYTDGLIEARSATNEEFGIERVEHVLCSNSRAAVATIYENLVSAVRSWTPVQQDDVTLIVARRESS